MAQGGRRSPPSRCWWLQQLSLLKPLLLCVVPGTQKLPSHRAVHPQDVCQCPPKSCGRSPLLRLFLFSSPPRPSCTLPTSIAKLFTLPQKVWGQCPLIPHTGCSPGPRERQTRSVNVLSLPHRGNEVSLLSEAGKVLEEKKSSRPREMRLTF